MIVLGGHNGTNGPSTNKTPPTWRSRETQANAKVIENILYISFFILLQADSIDWKLLKYYCDPCLMKAKVDLNTIGLGQETLWQGDPALGFRRPQTVWLFLCCSGWRPPLHDRAARAGGRVVLQHRRHARDHLQPGEGPTVRWALVLSCAARYQNAI